MIEISYHLNTGNLVCNKALLLNFLINLNSYILQGTILCTQSNFNLQACSGNGSLKTKQQS